MSKYHHQINLTSEKYLAINDLLRRYFYSLIFKKNILILFVLSVASVSSGFTQATIQDEGKMKEAIEWLENRLSYSYQNKSTGEWWNNKLFFDVGSNEINIKNSSSDIPNGASKNVYYDRKVLLTELDMRSVRIEKVEQGDGRIPKGKVVKVNVIGNEKKIRKSYNGKASSDEYFLQISFPESDSSLYALAEDCKRYFMMAIDMASRIYPTSDSLQNTNLIFNTLPGSYLGVDGSVCQVIELFPYTLELQFFKQDKLFMKNLLKYDPSSHRFNHWVIDAAKGDNHLVELETSNWVRLENKIEKFVVTLISLHQFSIEDNSIVMEYFRSGF
ncbi:hypothetical protein [Reichenbachiella sp. MALMAid0571]|uniref:hypothetical protein n=1 Tax=Reichenbachiella sp. MALMAid0571 TaxID=3143939 RepID=UPI0032DFB925